jgi:hypothetical protein
MVPELPEMSLAIPADCGVTGEADFVFYSAVAAKWVLALDWESDVRSCNINVSNTYPKACFDLRSLCSRQCRLRELRLRWVL